MGRGGGMSGGRGGCHSSGGSHGFSSSRSSSRSSSYSSSRSSSHSRGGGFSFSFGSSYSRPYRPGSTYVDRSRRTTYAPIIINNSGNRYSDSSTRSYDDVSYDVPPQASKVTVFVVFAVILIVCFMLAYACSSTVPSSYSGVTHTHTKMNQEGVTRSSEWIDDQVDWLSNEKTVTEALQYFENKTGVQPYLIITDNVYGESDFTDAEAEKWLGDVYWDKFNDDGHMIVAFVEYEESVYVDYVYTGRLANGTIDDEARNIIMDKFDMYYTDSSLSDDEYFAKVFRTSADTIMVDYDAGVDRKTNAGLVFLVGSGIIVVLIVGGHVINRAAESKRAAYEAAQKLASTPVDSMSDETDSVADELEKKYS